jgi:type I restriction enzyme R subunit
MTRQQRAAAVRKGDYFERYEATARSVLSALLDKYADEGIESIEDIGVLRIRPFDALGAPMELVEAFGGPAAYMSAVRDLGNQLYRAA